MKKERKKLLTCELELCVYNSGSQCILDQIQIDAQGMCCTCILVSFEKALLEQAKETQRRALEDK